MIPVPGLSTGQLPAFQPRHTVHPGREIGVMGGDEGRQPFFTRKIQEEREDGLRCFDIEIARRLICQQHAGAIGEGAGDGNALFLPAGKLPRAMRGAFGEAYRLQKRCGAFFGISKGDTGGALRQDDILGGGKFRQEMMRLIDESTSARLAAVRSASASRVIALPPISTSPELALSSSPAICSRVDFPAPEGATRATISPACRVRSTPRSTSTAARPAP